MIRLKNVTKTYHLKGNHKTIARNATMNFPTGKSIALLGRNGAGKSSLLSMIAGAIQPDSGTIEIDGTVSWPVGFMGSFNRDMSGAQNIRFLARVYGVDTEELTEFVRRFSELGGHFHQPVHTYSSGMRSRLGFACSMGIHFDWYLVDEVTAVGDAAFKEKSKEIFLDRMRNSSAVFVSHSLGDIRNVCDAAVVLEDGRMRYYRDLEEGIERHEFNMRKAPPG
ncbi:ABC transporter ATP-binding protein [Sulfitobacter sp. HNIBRBA3233]|uniref:ABC transporter ATP-binding protein n=1 Tax=Sulfitobacter marinivivus TaxID=3158558 RepID=UPI0032E002D3